VSSLPGLATGIDPNESSINDNAPGAPTLNAIVFDTAFGYPDAVNLNL
jgi:hypothetical protein